MQPQQHSMQKGGESLETGLNVVMRFPVYFVDPPMKQMDAPE